MFARPPAAGAVDDNAQAPAAGAADDNAGACNIIDGGEDGDGAVAGSKDPAASAVQLSQAAFVVPEGFKRVGGDKRNPSNMYKFGVRVEAMKTVPKHQPREGRWYCMGNAACRRASETFIRIKSNNTAAATTHLKLIHGISSKRGDKIIKR